VFRGTQGVVMWLLKYGCSVRMATRNVAETCSNEFVIRILMQLVGNKLLNVCVNSADDVCWSARLRSARHLLGRVSMLYQLFVLNAETQEHYFN